MNKVAKLVQYSNRGIKVTSTWTEQQVMAKKKSDSLNLSLLIYELNWKILQKPTLIDEGTKFLLWSFSALLLSDHCPQACIRRARLERPSNIHRTSELPRLIGTGTFYKFIYFSHFNTFSRGARKSTLVLHRFISGVYSKWPKPGLCSEVYWWSCPVTFRWIKKECSSSLRKKLKSLYTEEFTSQTCQNFWTAVNESKKQILYIYSFLRLMKRHWTFAKLSTHTLQHLEISLMWCIRVLPLARMPNPAGLHFLCC